MKGMRRLPKRQSWKPQWGQNSAFRCQFEEKEEVKMKTTRWPASMASSRLVLSGGIDYPEWTATWPCAPVVRPVGDKTYLSLRTRVRESNLDKESQPVLLDETVSNLDSHGLRGNALSPVETLAQSIASIAPTA